MLTIYKYQVTMDDYFTLSLPKGAKFISVQVQNQSPQLWSLVDINQPQESRLLRLAGTGHPIDANVTDLEFIGTFQLRDGGLVFHLFEILKTKAAKYAHHARGVRDVQSPSGQ